MPPTLPLAGIRLLDLSDDSGRLAGKILAQLGAEVVRLRRCSPGAPLRSGKGGVLEWWYDAGTSRLDVDLDQAAGIDAFRRLARGADALIETAPPEYLAARGIDHGDLHRLNPSLVHVSLTPFGRQGPRAAWQASDLVIAALGGLLSVCGTPDRPLNGWGRQWFNVGGLYAAIAALAGVHAVREGAAGMHFDLSLQHCATSCSEQLLMYWLHMAHVPARQSALHWTGLYDVVACRDGHVMMTVAPTAENLLAWLLEEGRAGSLGESPPQNALEWVPRAAEAMGVMRAWAADRSAGPTFLEAQRRNLAFGHIRPVAEVASCPQHAARAFFTADGEPGVRAPVLPFVAAGTTRTQPSPPPAAATPLAEVVARWTPRPAPTATPGESAKPLAGMRVLDFTWVLAGPMATRVFADLGADVVKLQTEERASGANHNEFPFFLMWNRGKRSACLNMKHAGAADVFRRLLERADVVVDNFAPGVLDRWGVGWEKARGWNPRAVYLHMPGCGLDGPWRDFVTYAPTIQALSGLTHLTNPPGRGDVGLGVSLNDHVSGLFGAVAVLAALEQRRRTGEGQLIDLSQLEVGTYLAGPALLDFLDSGREAEPGGNADAFELHVPSDVYLCGDGEWLAVSARDDAEWQRLCAAIGAADLAADAGLATAIGRAARRDLVDARLAAWAGERQAPEAMETLQGAGVAAGWAQNASHLTDLDPQLAARRWMVQREHATLGPQRHDCFPAFIDGRPVEPAHAPPILGQHSFDVYRELLDMSDEEIAAAIGEGLFV